MSGRIALGQMRAVAAVAGGEQRIRASGRVPPLAHGGRRQGHGVGRLVAGHAGPAVRPERREERVAARIDGAGGVEDAERAGGVRVERLGGQRPAVAGLPPFAAAAALPDSQAAATAYVIRDRRSTVASFGLVPVLRFGSTEHRHSVEPNRNTGTCAPPDYAARSRS